MTKSDDDDLIADVIDRGRKGRPIAWAWVGDLSRSHRPGGHVWRFSVSTAASWSTNPALLEMFFEEYVDAFIEAEPWGFDPEWRREQTWSLSSMTRMTTCSAVSVLARLLAPFPAVSETWWIAIGP